jgi:hypothetical protein
MDRVDEANGTDRDYQLGLDQSLQRPDHCPLSAAMNGSHV